MNTFRGNRDEFVRQLNRLIKAAAGDDPSAASLVRGVQLRIGVAALSKIQQAFIVKSRGGVGSDGIKWQPLKRETIAYSRRITKKEFKAAGVKGRTSKGLLNPEQILFWRKVYRSMLAMLLAKGEQLEESKRIAASIAWARVKKEMNAKTIIGLFGSRKVDTLRDTGLLFRSLAPGVQDRPSNAAGQVFETPPGEVIIGTVEKPWHHKGVPGKLPARPLWPEELPQSWWDAINKAALRGFMLAIAQLTQGTPPPP